MDHDQQTSGIIGPVVLPTAQLLVGPAAATRRHAIVWVQKLACLNQGCQICRTCRSIAELNYHALTWIAPKERYVLDDFIPLTNTVALRLEEHQHHTIVIEYAHILSAACANSLLKIIEEPPPGYHFLLLAQSLNRIMPTVRSRCITLCIGDIHSYSEHPLLACFIHEKTIVPSAFMKLLDTSKVTEQETTDLLDHLLHFVLEQIKQTLAHNQEPSQRLKQRLSVLKKVCSRPVPSGSSKLIWRELFLQWNELF